MKERILKIEMELKLIGNDEDTDQSINYNISTEIIKTITNLSNIKINRIIFSSNFHKPDNIFKEGFDAACRGDDLGANPYPSNVELQDSEYIRWVNGYHAQKNGVFKLFSKIDTIK